MCFFELTATPLASPRCMSGGKCSTLGTESNGITGTGAGCCASAGLAISTAATANQILNSSSLSLRRGAALFLGQADHVQQGLEMRAHRQLETLAGRQLLQEPFFVHLGDLARLGEALEGALDDRGEIGI